MNKWWIIVYYCKSTYLYHKKANFLEYQPENYLDYLINMIYK